MDPMMASIMIFGGNFAPRDWAFCDGQILTIASNTALYSLLGFVYGGDGHNTFALPDLRGRAPIGPRQGPGLSYYDLGERNGYEVVTLLPAQMPTHNHEATFTATSSSVTVKASSSLGTQSVPGTSGATTLAATANGRTAGQPLYNSETPDVTLNVGNQTGIAGTVTVGNNGGNQPHVNMQPYLAINYIIATNGLYPSRN